MSSDYYGNMAGEIADMGSDAERVFTDWIDAWTRRDPYDTTPYEDLRIAFMAGFAAGFEFGKDPEPNAAPYSTWASPSPSPKRPKSSPRP